MAPTKSETRTSLSREVVADRALVIADAEGIEAVTIRRLATELGVTPMALYWHFRTKEDLLAGLADRVLDAVVVPAAQRGLGGRPPRRDDGTGDGDATAPADRPPGDTQIMRNPDRPRHHRDWRWRSWRMPGSRRRRRAPLAMQALRSVVSMVTSDQVDDSGITAEERDAPPARQAGDARARSRPEKYPALIRHADAMTYCPDVEEFYDLGIDLYVQGVQGLASAVRR